MANEIFNYERVQSVLNELEDYFDTFATEVRNANEAVVEHLNKGPTLYGDYGKSLLNLWEENSSTFGDFKANFDDWIKMVSLVGINNQKFENYISKTSTQMTEEEFAGTYYGKKVEQRRNPIDSDDYDGDISKNGNLKRYTNKDGVVEKTIFYDDNGNIIEYNIFEVSFAGKNVNGYAVYKSICRHYVPDGNGGYVIDNTSAVSNTVTYDVVSNGSRIYASTDFQDAINYNENNTTNTRNRRDNETVTETSSNPLENLSDGQLYYDSSKSDLSGSYRDSTGRSYGDYTYYGTGADGTVYFTRGSSNDLYVKNSNGINMKRAGFSSSDFTLYNNSNIGSAKSDYDSHVAATTFTFDSSATGKRDPNIVRGGHTFQYFGTSSDGTMYYKYQSNSDTLYVFDGNNAVKVTDFDADDITFK